MRVEVYKNLHNGLMSVRECGGRVLTHENTVFIHRPRFVVQPAGRERVLREGRKNVHAFVRGECAGFAEGTLANFAGWENWEKVSYNPYKTNSFYDKTTLDPVHEADYAVVTTEGVFYRVHSA